MRAMLIIGAGGSGKTRRAIEEAEKKGGNYANADWEEISDGRFGLGRAIGSGPKTVIVEGLPSRLLTSEKMSFLKYLIDQDELFIEEQHKKPRAVPAPFFIFTMMSPLKFDLEQSCFSRFEVIQL